jgi:hypothetical protein
VEITNNIMVLNRFNKLQSFSSTHDGILKPEYQEMFSISEKVGYVKRKEKGFMSSNDVTNLFVLTDMGLLILDTSRYEFKGFIPLLGTKLKVQVLPEDKKQNTNQLYVFYSNNKDFEALVFSSQVDKQEWATKILKIQERSITL